MGGAGDLCHGGSSRPETCLAPTMPVAVPMDLPSSAQTFGVVIQKHNVDQDIGVEVLFKPQGLEVEAIFRGELIDQVNRQRATEGLLMVQVGDLIQAVNGVEGDMDMVADEVKRASVLNVVVARPAHVKRVAVPESTLRSAMHLAAT